MTYLLALKLWLSNVRLSELDIDEYTKGQLLKYMIMNNISRVPYKWILISLKQGVLHG